jgi:hypothetical protein
MRRIKKMMAVLMLAVVASLGAQTAFAGVTVSDRSGVTVSDRNGILLSDKAATKADDLTMDIIVVVVNSLTGIYLSD